MIRDKKVLAVIPARGGSKKLPGKNILNLNNKPLIAWSIDAARKSEYIDYILVSTDDDEILNVAKSYGADAPFKRPAGLSEDNSKTIDVILHALEWLINKNEHYDIMVLLQPTSPLRISEDIDKALELLFEKNADAIISVCPAEHNPLWTNRLPEDGRMNNFLDRNIINKNRQELPEYFRLNGAVFVAFIEYLEKNKSFYGENTFAYIMPQERSVDVDSEIDLEICRVLLKHQVK